MSEIKKRNSSEYVLLYIAYAIVHTFSDVLLNN